MSTSFSLRIDLPTQIALKNAVTGLEKISGERIRDELFKLMESRNIERSLRIADRLGLIKYLLPELDRLKRVPQPLPHQLDAWDHTLQTVGQVERLLSVIAGEYHPDQANELRLGLAVLYLGRFRERLTQRYQKSVTPPRSIKSLLLLAGLYHDSGKADTLTRDFDATIHFYRHEKRSVEILSERARQLSLSNLETSLVSTIIGNHMRPHQLSNDLEVLSNRAIYRYFRATGDAGIDICILTLADTLATYGVTLPQDVWTKELKTCQQILNAYFDTPELTVNPIRLVTGDDLIKEFQLFPGPLIGELLEFIREAQASGEIMTRQDAFDLVKQRLRSHL
jgi:tRNA nucleotidyltransferase/poly(A) polymerase